MASASNSTMTENSTPISLNGENAIDTRFAFLAAIESTHRATSQSQIQSPRLGLEATAVPRRSAIINLEAEPNNASTVLPSEQTVISSELEASFDGLFVITPPLSPKSNPLPYFQRPESPRVTFLSQTYTLPRSSDDITDLAGMLSEVNLRSSVAGQTEVNIPRTMANLISRGRVPRLPPPHPFPGVNLDYGWNRARCALDDSVYSPEPSYLAWPEEKKRVRERFNGFGFVTQMKPIQLDNDDFSNIVEKIFVGNGSIGRKPDTWWAVRKSLFRGWHGKLFLKHVMLKFMIIVEKVVEWKNVSPETIPNIRKRKASDFPEMEEQTQVTRKLKAPKRALERVMDDECRERRRSQEKKAGRWTDGTLGMDRMWEQFYWVLNVDDPKDATWGSDTRMFSMQRFSVGFSLGGYSPESESETDTETDTDSD